MKVIFAWVGLGLFLSFKMPQLFASDCAQRLNHWNRGSSACIILGDNEALMVWVPYGSQGWDFPGGQSKEYEYACETAERETCEETGHRVQAVAQITDQIFLCDIVQWNACQVSVDEGRLDHRYFKRWELDQLQLRPNTWGDKRNILSWYLRY